MTDCATLWIGAGFGPVERACLRSVVRQGHRVTLYCYDQPIGIPDGVETADASSILPQSSIVRHRRGSVAPFSDWFRYELLKRAPLTWIDTDMYLVRPLPSKDEHLFGQERPGVINNAILRLPADSPMLDELLAPFRGAMPAWLAPRHRLGFRLRKWLSGEPNIGALPWGATGPAALTAVAARFGMTSLAQPHSAFYPVPWERAGWIVNPALKLEDMVTDSTIGVHLWNHCIRSLKNQPAPDGSFLHRLWDEGSV